MLRKKILIVEDDQLLSQQVAFALQKDYEIFEAPDRILGEKTFENEAPDLLLVDLNLPPSGKSDEGIRLLERVKQSQSDAVLIVMSGNTDMNITLKAVDAGAYDFFRKPFDLTELKLIVRRALEKQAIERENLRLQDELQRKYSFQNIVGRSPAMQRVFEAVKRVASTDATVIVRGESGTGKELIARAIHYNSKRREGSFVSVNCAALPETLIETELFGHEKGAFTGAVTSHTGRFELADGGTLFLDEIGSVSQLIQTKLLRVLQERCFERVGGTKEIAVDVRLITATNEDLEKKVEDGSFREDLYYRISVFPILVPALRERKEDIPLLLDHFLQIYCTEHNISPKKFHLDALHALTAYTWKGNVREMENLIQTMLLMVDSDIIQEEHLPPHITGKRRDAEPYFPLTDEGIDLGKAVKNFEKGLIQSALERSKGKKSEAARFLRIDKNRMKYLCRKYKI